MVDSDRIPGPSSTSRAVGEPVTFLSGPFAHQTLRAELCIVQEALFCRKSSPRDRRPIEPPPVISINLFRITQNDKGAATEVEITDHRTVPYVGFAAHVDVFEAPLSVGNASVTVAARDAANPHVYANLGGEPLGKESRATHVLAGSTVSSALCLPVADRHTLLFVFSDLSCRQEGLYVPRYRCTYIVSPTANEGVSFPIMAEVWGKPFRVYSASDQPTLPASSELTKELLRLGVPVHARAKESGKRKRRKNDDNTSASDEQPSTDGSSGQSNSASDGSM